MPNLYWIAYYKSLLIRNLMTPEQANMHIRRLREFERHRRYRFHKRNGPILIGEISINS